jgi:hypothetical protein
MRICIVADAAFARFGGEAVLHCTTSDDSVSAVWRRGWLSMIGAAQSCNLCPRSASACASPRYGISPRTFCLSGLLPRRIAESTVGLKVDRILEIYKSVLKNSAQ